MYGLIAPGFNQGDNGFNYGAIEYVFNMYPELVKDKRQLYFEKCLIMVGVIERERKKRREKAAK